MNDAPVTPAAETAPVAAPEQAAQQPSATAAPAETTTPEAKPERTFSQKELDDILEKRLAKERRRREDLQRRLTVTEELALRGRQTPEPEKATAATPAKDARPTRDQFDAYEDYLRADARWEAKQEVAESMRTEREASERTKAQEARVQVEKTFREHAAKAASRIPDFEDVIASSQAMITEHMSDAMMSAGEIGPDILFHLAGNAEESRRIAALSPSRQAAEIGKLEAKLAATAPEAKKPSAAPAPIKPLTGKTPAVDDEPPASDTKAWIAWRQRQVQAKRGGVQP